MGRIASLDGLLIVHAEDAEAIERAAAPGSQGRRYGDFLASRPREAENVAVAHVIDLARHTGCRVHILHVSSAEAPLIAAAKDEGIRVTAETCPHYLYFADEEVPEGATQFKCCPPIREADNGSGSGTGWLTGPSTSSCPTTRHRPRSSRRWTRVTSGSRGEESARCSSGSRSSGPRRASGFQPRRRDALDGRGPADLVGLSRQGRIAVGADADFCVFAPETVSSSTRRSRTIATRSLRMTGGACSASCARPGCAASGSTSTPSRAVGSSSAVRHERGERRPSHAGRGRGRDRSRVRPRARHHATAARARLPRGAARSPGGRPRGDRRGGRCWRGPSAPTDVTDEAAVARASRL